MEGKFTMAMRAFAFVLSIFVSLTSFADNPFGIPEPEDPERPGTILLHGGGRITDEVFERFVELAGGKSAHIVLVPSAGFDTRHYSTIEEFQTAVENRYHAWVSLHRDGRIAEFTILHTEEPDEADRPEFTAPLARATGVWFTGGDQARLNYRYVGGEECTLFQTELKKVLRRGGVVGGTSAGTAVIPEIMTMGAVQENEGEALSAQIAHGLGLMNRVIVEQHFDTRLGRFERFLGLLKDNERLDEWSRQDDAGAKMIGLAIDEPGAAEVSDDHVRAWGPGHVHLFVKRDHGRVLEWHDIEPDQIVTVRPTEEENLYQIVRNEE